MNEIEARNKIKLIFLSTFPNLKGKNFSFTKKQSEYESWDSFAHMQIVSDVEKIFRISLDIHDLTPIESAEDIVRLLRKKRYH